MDAPYRSNFADLAALANNRATWKRLVEVKFGKNKCKKENPRNSDDQNPTAHTFKTARPKTSKASLHSAPWRERALGRWVGSGADAVWIGPDPEPQCRDVDPIRRTANVAAGILIPVNTSAKQAARMVQTEIPATWRPALSTKPGATISKNSKNVKVWRKPKQTALTDAQRAAWAHAHYIIHHGTNEDAARFLTHPKLVRNTPSDALHRVRVMAAMRVPTWDEAAAAVFSSSSSCEGSLSITAISITPEASATTWDEESATAKTSDKCNKTNTKTPTITKEPTVGAIDDKARAISALTITGAGEKEITMTATNKRHRTRSSTAKAREEAATAAMQKLAPPPTSTWTPKPRRKRTSNKPSKRPKRVRIAPSAIPGAGMGLYLEEDAKAREWIARYSGEVNVSRIR